MPENRTATHNERCGVPSSSPAPAAWILFWLAIALLTVDASLYVAMRRSQPIVASFWQYFLAGISLSQTALVVLLLVFSPHKFALRFISCGLALFGLAHVGSSSNSGDPREWFGGLVLHSMLLLIPAIIARLAGVRLRVHWTGHHPMSAVPSKDIIARRDSPKNSSLQFSLFGLLILMALVGLTLAVAKIAIFPWRDIWRHSYFFVLLVASSVVILGLALHLQRLRWWLLPLIFGACVAIVASDLYASQILLYNLVATVLMASVLRVAGLRFVRERRLPSEARFKPDCEQGEPDDSAS